MDLTGLDWTRLGRGDMSSLQCFWALFIKSIFWRHLATINWLIDDFRTCTIVSCMRPAISYIYRSSCLLLIWGQTSEFCEAPCRIVSKQYFCRDFKFCMVTLRFYLSQYIAFNLLLLSSRPNSHLIPFLRLPPCVAFKLDLKVMH
jgi:hypothetical protein